MNRIAYPVELMYFNVKNLHGVIYKHENVDNLDQIISDSNNNRLLGEIMSSSSMYPSLDIVSHLTKDIRIIDDVMYGEVEPLDTFNGKELVKLIECGSVVFRPRLLGDVNDNGVVTNMKIYSFDAVLASNDSFGVFVREKKLLVETIREDIVKNGGILDESLQERLVTMAAENEISWETIRKYISVDRYENSIHRTFSDLRF